MTEPKREVVVTRAEAVFWLDENGCWCNRHGKFEHKKIIDYFHRAIRRDRDGYYLVQEHDTIREKVYFRYVDAALFAIDVILGAAPELILNTRRRMPLDPAALFVQADRLYMQHGDERIKFSPRAMLKVADLIEEGDRGMVFVLAGQRYPIDEIRCSVADVAAGPAGEIP